MQPLIISLLLLIVRLSQASADELLFVHALWRHGDRSPISTFPKDPYRESQWPQGWGELSAVGMQQHFALGTRIRSMYKGFISATYKPSEIYVESTDVNRTLMSAVSNMAGFYQSGQSGVTYPDSNSVPNWPSNWSPIPVHTVADDPNIESVPCPRRTRLREQMLQRESYKNIVQENKQYLDFLTNVTGMHITVADTIGVVQDALFIEQLSNLTMPPWLNDSIWNQMLNLSQISDEFYYGVYPPAVPELIRLNGGIVLKAIIEEMQLKLYCIQNPSDISSKCVKQRPRKYYVYSGHDSTIGALLSTLIYEREVLNMLEPKYASSTVLELWNTTTGPQVKILYHPAFHMDFYPITNLTQGCPSNSDFCPFDTFVERSKPYIPVDLKAECQAK